MKIRQKLSLTQQQLADLLGVSRSLVNQYEWGKRNLPREALQKLIQLEMESKKVEGKSAPDPTLLFSQNGLNRLILKYTLKLQRIGEYIVILRMRLKKMEKEFSTLQRKHHILSTTLLLKEELTEKKKLLSDINLHRTNKSMKAVNGEAQFELQYRIDNLESEVTIIKQAINQLHLEKFKREENIR